MISTKLLLLLIFRVELRTNWIHSMYARTKAPNSPTLACTWSLLKLKIKIIDHSFLLTKFDKSAIGHFNIPVDLYNYHPYNISSLAGIHFILSKIPLLKLLLFDWIKYTSRLRKLPCFHVVEEFGVELVALAQESGRTFAEKREQITSHQTCISMATVF